MTRGLCTAAVTLTDEEYQSLLAMPDGAEALEAAGCIYKATHEGPHAALVQREENDENTHWWAVWEGPEQPDSVGYEIVAIEPCHEPKPGSVLEIDDCPLPKGHAGEHRW